jgi:anti-sigma factor RsiW
MNTFGNHNQNLECREMQPLLSEYVENTLSARDTWRVEKHLTECSACAAQTRELQATVALLRNSARFDTSADFMANLHARLDGLEPESARPRALWATLRDWLAGATQTLRTARVPALSLGLATTALIAVLLVPHEPRDPVTPPPPASDSTGVAPIASQTLRRNVALAASNPFDDPVAANLAAHAAMNETETP